MNIDLQCKKSQLFEINFHFGSNLQKRVPNHDPEHYSPKDKMLRVVILHLVFGDLSQSEKLCEIKLPLEMFDFKICRKMNK